MVRAVDDQRRVALFSRRARRDDIESAIAQVLGRPAGEPVDFGGIQHLHAHSFGGRLDRAIGAIMVRARRKRERSERY
jgi:hypothetical protein